MIDTVKSRGPRPGACLPFFERFDRVVVINLASRVDRRREMARQLGRVGLSFDHPRVRRFDAVRPAAADGFPSIGARGCFLSHLGVLDDARSLDSVLILEDDLDFVRDAEAAFAAANARVPEDWSILYGGLPTPRDARVDEGYWRVPSGQALVTAHFVALRADAIALARRLLADMLERPAGDPRGGPMHVDGAYNWLRARHPELATWAASPPLGFQRASRTDIHPLRLGDRLPGVRACKQGLRRMLWPSPK